MDLVEGSQATNIEWKDPVDVETKRRLESNDAIPEVRGLCWWDIISKIKGLYLFFP